MKNLSVIILILSLAYLGCEKTIEGPYIKYGNPPSIVRPTAGQAFTLSEDQAKNVFAEITWYPAEFGFSAGVAYEVQMASKGTSFKDPITLGILNSLTLNTITTEKINTILIGQGIEPGKAVDLELRVIAKINNKVSTLISPSQAIKITPYKASLNFPKLQVPGSYQGWNPADNNTVIYSLKSDGKFEGFIYFPANTEFKYTDGPTWTTNYGDKGADGFLDKDGDNLKTTKAGYYRLRANLNDFSHSEAATDWGLIGSATANGWDSDQNLSYDAAKQIWTITAPLKIGEIKFRANDDWAINFGDNGANLSLEYDGANIAIPADGTYEIQLILNTPLYTYKITKK
jgi:hypothetical protein